MATKKEAIHITWGLTGRMATLWTDLSRKAIESIEGIAQAIPSLSNCFTVTIDPRYDRAEIYEEIKALAIEAADSESTD